VEDFTGRGLDDLRSGTLRTPIDPVRTLRDDPLRALRAIRFMYFTMSLH
jgi:tRNA nucleotidyltransferase (CCA-adding enzyme)